MDDSPGRACNRKSHCVLNRMVGLDELHPELSKINRLPRMDDLPLCRPDQIVLRQLQLYQPHRELCRIDGNIQLLQNIRECSDVIFMPMCEHEALHLCCIVEQIGDIRYTQINAVHVIFRKCETAIHDNDAVFILKCGNIHADGLEAAERNYL